MADYLKIPEVARRLDVSEKTARRYVKDGTLPSVFVGGAYRVSEEDLDEYLREARVQPGKAGAPPLPELEKVSEEERRYLSALLDPWTKQLRHLSNTCGPHLRLLPDAPPYEEMRNIFSWTWWLTDTCILIERVLDDRSFSEVVNPWLSRMNDETIPAEIRQKLHDFYAARTTLFEELEPLAEEWREAQKERVPDEALAKLNAEFRHLLEGPDTPRVAWGISRQ
ncbi:MAG: helix-turn-helix domain-containing protein [Actinomycetota bacterium]|nr:helix-turn-helix domain-containing protein [Actinomycetota bacterium]